MRKKKVFLLQQPPNFLQSPNSPRGNHIYQFLGAHSRDDLCIYNSVCVCVCVIDHRSQQSKFLWFLFEGVQFLVGLVFVFLFGGEVILCEIRESESELSQSWAISDFPKHLALVGLCCY